MDMDVQALPGGIAKAALRGRFDTTGAVMIELPLNTITTEKHATIVGVLLEPDVPASRQG